MGTQKYLDAIINNALGGIHTAYLATVLSVNTEINTAKIQPLGLVKKPDGTTEKQSVLSNVPICEHVRHYRLVQQELTLEIHDTYTGGGNGKVVENPHPTQSNVGHLRIDPIEAGDVVVCVCCERNISEAKRGVNALPPTGRFGMSDSIIIGVL